MAMYRPGDIIRFPLGTQAGPIGSVPTLGRYDEAYYDYNTDSYRTRSQDIKIAQLEEEIAQKKKDDREKIKSIVGYFYKRR